MLIRSAYIPLRRCFSLYLCVLMVSAILQSASAQARETVRISGSSGTSATLIWLAEQIGAFERQDIEVEIIPFDAGWQSIEAMRKGQVDLAAAADFAYVKMGLNDDSLIVVSQLCRAGDNGIVANRQQGIKTVADLAHKRIGFTRGTSSEFYLAQSLLEQGLTLNDIEPVHLPPHRMAISLATGQVDAISSWEPWNYKAARTINGDAVSFPVMPGQATLFLLLGQRNWLDTHQASVVRVLRALQESEVFLQQPDAADRVAEFYGQRFLFDKAFIHYFYGKQHNALGLSQSLLPRLETQAEWLMQARPEGDVPNYLERLYFKGLDTVNPASVTVIR